MTNYRTILVTVMLFLMFAGQARSSEMMISKESASRWQDYFYGHATVIDLTQNTSNIIDYNGDLYACKSNLTKCMSLRSQCQVIVDRVSRLVRNYGESAKFSLNEQTDEIWSQLSRLLFEEVGESHVCYQAALRNYVLNSLPLIQSPKSYKDEKDNRYSPSVLALVALYTVLNNEGKIGFISSDDTKESIVQGAYQCTNSKIFIDPHLRPLNLASVFVHELSHLMRDKFLSWDKIKSDFKVNGELQWDRYLLLDEALAIAHATYVQRNLSVPETTKLELVQSDFGGQNYKERFLVESPFGLLNDRNLVSDNGPLSQLWSVQGIEFSGRSFIESIWACKTINYQGTCAVAGNSTIVNHRNNVYGIIYKNYFPSSVFSNQLLELTDPSRIDGEYSPLTTWIENIRNNRLFMRDRENYVVGISYQYLFSRLNDVKSSLSKVTKSCKGFVKASMKDNSALKDYINFDTHVSGQNKISISVQSRDGVKPSRDGVKPSRDGVKPCLSFKHIL